MKVDELFSKKEWESLLDDAELSASTDKEQEFVSDMRDKYAEYGRAMFLSEKQKAWLEKLAERGGSAW